MKSFNKLLVLVLTILMVLVIGINLFLFYIYNNKDGRPYLVEIERTAVSIENEDIGINLGKNYYNKFKYIRKIEKCDSNEMVVAASKYDYVIKNINGSLYKFEYEEDNSQFEKIVLILNILIGIIFVIVISILLYIKHRIIAPFHKLEDVPYELSKGNLTVPLIERKTKYFGKFVWGTNLLRENLEERRKKELNMHKEKKTLLLSLAHDIKTPLSVIKLNAQAIEKNVYKSEEKRNASANAIVRKVDEIEKYVSQIIEASKEEFLDFSMNIDEFYLKEVMENVTNYYVDKLEKLKINFGVGEYIDCLLLGDLDRIVEVIQNVVENAIKYGDGEWIKIEFANEENCQLIIVKNSGNTMKRDELLHVFDSFYRGSNVKKKDGSGLGLYIAKRLMTLMKGDIVVDVKDNEFIVTLVIKQV